MQQQPLEERLTYVETAAERHEQTIARLDAMIENHDQLLDRLVANQEYLQANLETLQKNQVTLASQGRIWPTMKETLQSGKPADLLEEVTRDAATTRRLWLRLAQRYGWIDDEQNGNQPETPT